MPTKVTAKTYLAAVKKGYDLEYQLADCQKDKLILEAMVKEQQAQLAEANEMRLAEANEMRLAEANEMRLAEANEKARLQVALDRIEATGYEWLLERTDGYVISIANCIIWNCATAVEAAEAAAAWAESQKEGEA